MLTFIFYAIIVGVIHKLPLLFDKTWEVVQRQDTGLWILVSGFESLPPSLKNKSRLVGIKSQNEATDCTDNTEKNISTQIHTD